MPNRNFNRVQVRPQSPSVHTIIVHGLSEEQLATREVEYIDIASTETNYWSYLVGNNNVDFTKFKSERAGRGPLLEGWQDRCDPVMTAYKLVTIDAPYWGFGYRLEQALVAGEKALFLESHRNCFSWIDEWYGMTMQQVREVEQQTQSALNEKLGKPTLVTRIEGDKGNKCVTYLGLLQKPPPPFSGQTISALNGAQMEREGLQS
nr:cytoplasmic phosphatidylinositol transfer protein 1 [Quercus suber]